MKPARLPTLRRVAHELQIRRLGRKLAAVRREYSDLVAHVYNSRKRERWASMRCHALREHAEWISDSIVIAQRDFANGRTPLYLRNCYAALVAIFVAAVVGTLIYLAPLA